MSRHVGFLAAIVAATVIGHTGTLGGAGSTISGTVTITGQAPPANALVYIQEAPGTFPPGAPAQMDQRAMQFVPHMLPVVSGTTVKFLNSDPTPHNVFSPDYEKYDLGTWQQGQTKEYTFPECAKPPCVYTQLCKVHVEMDGYVAVLQNPYSAVTDKKGHYEIANVPPGSYMLAGWYASRTRRYKALPTPVTVDAGGPATVDLVLGR